MIQGSPEWHSARLGRVTASRVADVMAKTKTGWGASRANYMAELIAERLTGAPADRFVSDAMRWGTEKEPEARGLYEFRHGATVEEIGFICHPRVLMSGASPDGLVGSEGLVEIKAPNTNTHLETLLGQGVPERYVTQMQWQMACCERQWCDFISYDPRMPAHMRLFVSRIERDGARITELEHEVAAFLRELDDKVIRLHAAFQDAA